MFTSRTGRLREMLTGRDWRQEPLVFSVPGFGLSARSAVQEGIPFLMVLNAGVYRAMGVVSQASFLPFGNANEQVEQLIGREILPSCPDTPLVAGLFAGSETIPLKERFARLKALGVAGSLPSAAARRPAAVSGRMSAYPESASGRYAFLLLLARQGRSCRAGILLAEDKWFLQLPVPGGGPS